MQIKIFLSSIKNKLYKINELLILNLHWNSLLLFLSNQILIILSFEHETKFPFKKYFTSFILSECAFSTQEYKIKLLFSLIHNFIFKSFEHVKKLSSSFTLAELIISSWAFNIFCNSSNSVLKIFIDSESITKRFPEGKVKIE